MSLSADTTRLGVVGTGAMGTNHVRVLRRMDCAELVGIFDMTAARAESVAADHGTRAFTDLSRLIDAVDGVVLATPTFGLMSSWTSPSAAPEASATMAIRKSARV